MSYRKRPRRYNNRGRHPSRGRSNDYHRDRASPPRKYEDWVWQLEYLEHGYMDDPRPKHLREPIVQALGEKYFSLMEIILDSKTANNFKFEPGIRTFIGKGEENKVGHRFKRTSFEKLTIDAKAEIPKVLQKIIEQDPKRFIDFYNNSKPITNRMHQLELLPGIGKKTMWQIIDARKRKLFESFEDIQERAGITKPKEIIVKRIIKELEDRTEKHLIFVRN